MANQKFDRASLSFIKLNERKSKFLVERDMVSLTQKPALFPDPEASLVKKTSDRIRRAIAMSKPVMLAFGAHAIKNGMAPALIALMEEGYLTHIATNGAAIIHDWEIAFHGKTSEDVRENVPLGRFGIWEETGFFINLALAVGAYEGLGYGESVGKMISREGLQLPQPDFLYQEAEKIMRRDPDTASSAIQLAGIIKTFGLIPGSMSIPHPFRKYSVQARAFELGIPFTGHPMIGHDIIYCHPLNNGSAVGQTALRDFLTFAGSIAGLDDGVYMSVGSAVMSPMIFEKSLSMAQNIRLQHGSRIDGHFILVVDLARSEWDWQKAGEPPADNPAYFLRYCKTFSRMGGETHYLSADNRDFLLTLYQLLASNQNP
jgi:hypothetical protein